MTEVPPGDRAPLVVLDTVVVIRGIIGRRDGVDALVLRAVATGEVRLAVSDDGLRELQRVMGYESVREKISDPARAFAVGLDMGVMGKLFRPRRYDWPTLPDPKDRWVLDLAYEAGSSESRAPYVVTHDGHFLDRRARLGAMGFRIVTPEQLLDDIRPEK
ncbi:MAG: PIN domain-containing protein [Rubrobacteraceae bacterium]